MKLPLSVLDLSPVGAGIAPSQAIRDSIALCRIAEGLGYTRYWFAEHHNMASIATSAPEVLIAAAATATTKIKLLAARKPGEPHPYEIGKEAVARYFTVTEECAQAQRLKVMQMGPKQ